MKRLLSTILILLTTLQFTIQAVAENERPKIAVVLAGGGAKGIAHIPVLKAIEDAGIPVDMVVGTSIGSIVGGLYCTGYSPDTMRQIVRSTDWIKLITDNPDFGQASLSSKKADESYLLRFSFDANRLRSKTGRGGMIYGTNVERFFKQLTRFLPDTLDFGDMPIPFACVGTNAVTGECKVFDYGNVPRAMRASMAIPTVFTPVTIDSVVYVDGGVCDNFPVDIARQMGADIIIGVDLKVQTTEQQLTNSAIDLLMNCIDLYSMEKYTRNVADADIYIPIDVTGYSAASFGAAALDSLLCRGEYYASLKKSALDSLRTSLSLTDEPVRIRIGDYSFAKSHANTSWSSSEEEVATRNSLYEVNNGSMKSSINVAGRFDNVEHASLLAKANMVLSPRKAALLVLQARLGERLQAKVDISRQTFGTQRMGLSYKFQKHNIDMYHQGEKAINLKMLQNKFNYYFTQDWHNIKYSFGLNYNIFNYSDAIIDPNYRDKPFTTERFFTYYLTGEINTLDYQYYAAKGHRIELRADFITDNLISYKDKAIFPIFSINMQNSFALSERFSMSPHLFARVMISQGAEKPLALMNMSGGLFSEQHFLQQYGMAGVSNMELISEDGFGLVGITGQFNSFKNHYIRVTADVCTHTNHIQDALDSDNINWGINASYNIRTAFGPLSAKAYWNDINKSFDLLLSAGYYF